MSAHWPNKCTTMTAFVLGDRARMAEAGSSWKVAGSMSANTGVAPTSATTSAVEMNEKSGTMTSSSGPTSSARSASARASVPLPQPTTWPPSARLSLSRCSNDATCLPRMNDDSASTWSMAWSNSGRRRACNPPKSTMWMGSCCAPAACSDVEWDEALDIVERRR